MHSELHRYMTVGLVHPMAFPRAVGEKGEIYNTLLTVAKDEFFGSVEITSIPDGEERGRVKRLLDSSGLVVCYAAQPLILGRQANLNALNEEDRAFALKLLRQAVDEAYELGAVRLAIVSGPDPGEESRARAVDKAVESLIELCAYARAGGNLQIVLETFDFDVDKRRLLGPNALCLEVARRVREIDPSFGLMVDLSHFPLQHESTRDAVQLTREAIAHAHMGNCYMKDESDIAYGDLHPRFAYPGGENGAPELAEYLRELYEIGYIYEGGANIVAFEVKPLPEEEPEVVLAQSKRTLLEAWRLANISAR